MSWLITPNFHLRKITTGSSPGTWGNLLNHNFDTLDDYIGGDIIKSFDYIIDVGGELTEIPLTFLSGKSYYIKDGTYDISDKSITILNNATIVGESFAVKFIGNASTKITIGTAVPLASQVQTIAGSSSVSRISGDGFDAAKEVCILDRGKAKALVNYVLNANSLSIIGKCGITKQMNARFYQKTTVILTNITLSNIISGSSIFITKGSLTDSLINLRIENCSNYSPCAIVNIDGVLDSYVKIDITGGIFFTGIHMEHIIHSEVNISTSGSYAQNTCICARYLYEATSARMSIDNCKAETTLADVMNTSGNDIHLNVSMSSYDDSGSGIELEDTDINATLVYIACGTANQTGNICKIREAHQNNMSVIATNCSLGNRGILVEDSMNSTISINASGITNCNIPIEINGSSNRMLVTLYGATIKSDKGGLYINNVTDGYLQGTVSNNTALVNNKCAGILVGPLSSGLTISDTTSKGNISNNQDGTVGRNIHIDGGATKIRLRTIHHDADSMGTTNVSFLNSSFSTTVKDVYY